MNLIGQSEIIGQFLVVRVELNYLIKSSDWESGSSQFQGLHFNCLLNL